MEKPKQTHLTNGRIKFCHEDCFQGTEREGGMKLLENTARIVCAYDGDISRDTFVFAYPHQAEMKQNYLELRVQVSRCQACESPNRSQCIWLVYMELGLPQPGPSPHQRTPKIQFNTQCRSHTLHFLVAH